MKEMPMFKAIRSKTWHVICGAVLLASTTVTADAATWTGRVGRTIYNFSTVDGTVADLVGTVDAPGVLDSQPWWNDSGLAQEFAQAVGDHLGLSYDLNTDFGVAGGPIFASLVDNDGTLYGTFAYGDGSSLFSFAQQMSGGPSFTFALATPISVAAPEISSNVLPAAVFLVAVLFLWYSRNQRKSGQPDAA